MRTLICIPCLDMVHTEFMRNLLSLRIIGEAQYAIAQSSLVYDSRNILSVQAICGGFDRTLWLDSDMTFDPDLMERLSKRLDEGADLASGLYFSRKPPFRPVIYDGCRIAEINGKRQNIAVVYDDYHEGVFDIEACGFGGVMIRTSLLNAVREKFGHPFSPIEGFGEDLSFCMRAANIGAKMVCDSTVKMGHIGQVVISEKQFKEQSNAK